LRKLDTTTGVCIQQTGIRINHSHSVSHKGALFSSHVNRIIKAIALYKREARRSQYNNNNNNNKNPITNGLILSFKRELHYLQKVQNLGK